MLGGEVVESSPPEIGVLDIDMTAAAKDDPLFTGYPATIKAVQWHSWEVRGLDSNPEVTLLGSSEDTPWQIFRFRNNAWAMQFHVEVRADTIMQWGEVPEYRSALENSLGAAALSEFDQAARAHMTEMNRLAEQLYRNFNQAVSA